MMSIFFHLVRRILVPPKIICAFVQILSKDTFFHFVDENSFRRAEARIVSDRNERWSLEQNFDSRFFRLKCEEFLV